MTEIRHLSGYAYTHGPEPIDAPGEGWVENITREALERAVADRPAVPLRLGTDGPVIGQAHLSVDDTGLRVEAALAVGWGFRAKEQHWDEAMRNRTLSELSIQEINLRGEDF